jgi:hypothetical protein
MFVVVRRRRCRDGTSVDDVVSTWQLWTRNRVASSRAHRQFAGDGAREVSVSA